MSSNFGARASDVCYRHPDRQSFVLCQRCGRTICGECQTPAAVGVICPECLREQRGAMSTAQKRASRWGARGGVAPRFASVTNVIIAVTVVAFILQWIIPGFTETFYYAPLFSEPQLFEPWRMLTAVFLHSTGFILHILLNMYTLWIFGRALEQQLGRGRFLTLYLMAGFAGSLGVMFLAPINQAVVGASGAIFGLMGAFIVIQRRLGNEMRSLLVLVGINLVIGFLPNAGISWQAHLGGLVGGAIFGWICYECRGQGKNRKFWLLIGGLGAVMVLLSLFRLFVPTYA